MSLITELRSKRDRSDVASLMTVDEITAEVESRRESGGTDLTAVVAEKEPSSADEWTQVAFEDGSKAGTDGDTDSMLEPQEIIPDTVAEETEVEDEDDEEVDEDEYEYEDDEDDGGEAEDELTDDEPNKAITSRQGGAFPSIRLGPTVFLILQFSANRENHQVDQGCAYRRWVLRPGVPWYGCRHRSPYGSEAGLASDGDWCQSGA